MPLLIGVPREVFPGEKRVATVPEVVEKLDQAGLHASPSKRARATRRNFSDDAYRAAGAEIVADAAQLWAAPTSCSRCARRAPTKSRLMREGGTLVELHLAGAEPGADAAARGAEGDRARDGQRAAHLARAEDGRAVVDGEHRRLPRGHRGGARTSAASSPARSRPRARCRRRRCSSSAPASPASRRSARRRAWARSCAPTTRAPEVADQVKSLGGEFVDGRLRGGRHRRRRLRQGDERGLPEGAARDVREAGEGRRHHHHDRADPRQAGAEADHRRHGASR